MYILRNLEYELLPIEANRVERNDKVHYNILFGSRVRGGYEIRVGVDDSLTVGCTDNTIELKGDYNLIPIYKNGVPFLNFAKEPMQFLAPNKNSIDESWLLFLHIPFVEEHNITLTTGATLIHTAKFRNATKSVEGYVIHIEVGASVSIWTKMGDTEKRWAFKNRGGLKT